MDLVYSGGSGEEASGPVPDRLHGLLDSDFLVKENSDSNGPPGFVPPPGFCCKLLAGVWAMVPDMTATEVAPIDDNQHDLGGTGSQSRVRESPTSSAKSEDSVPVFERKLRILLLDLPCTVEESTADQPKSTCRSERPKKPSSRFTADASFVAELPKSTKKKVTPRGDTAEGTSKPLLLSDWSNAQIAKYCEACGIVFTDPLSDSIAHIRMLEQLRSTSV